MLLNFTFSNYKSFKEEQFFFMERPESIDYKKDSIVVDAPKGVKEISRVAAFYGANAAGKSNFLDALLYIKWLVVGHKDIKNDCYISLKDAPSTFSISFIAKNNLKYDYYISIQKNIVIEEKLSIYKTNQPTIVIYYSKEDSIFTVGSMFAEDEKTAIRFNFEKNQNQPIIRQLERSNSEEAKIAFDFFKNGIFINESSQFDVDMNPTKLAYTIETDEKIHNFLNETLSAADLGIKAVNLVEAESGANEEQQKILSKAFVDFAKAGNPKMSKEELKELGKTSSFANKIKKAVFEHEISGVKTNFEINRESDGTIAACGILLDLLPVLQAGSVYIVDELDRSLHPSIVAQIIDVFNHSGTNPNDAQLFLLHMTFHCWTLLFTEKIY